MKTKVVCAFVLAVLTFGVFLDSAQSQDLIAVGSDGKVNLNFGALATLVPPFITLQALKLKEGDLQTMLKERAGLRDELTGKTAEELKNFMTEVMQTFSEIDAYFAVNEDLHKDVITLLADWLDSFAKFVGENKDLLDRTGKLLSTDETYRNFIGRLVESALKVPTL